VESLGAARAELERFKSEICKQKHTEITSIARTLVQTAADVQAVFLHSQIIESIRICAQSVRDEFIATVRAEVAAMNYPQLRSYSAFIRPENNNIICTVRQRCGERLGWIMKKVELNVHEIATNLQHNIVEQMKVRIYQNLNGRILYPHTLAEAYGEYGNPTVGTNITLYTRNNIQYDAIVIENGEIKLPGLLASVITFEEFNEKHWVNSTPCVASFLPNISSVQIVVRIPKTEINFEKISTLINTEVSVTIPLDWTIGKIVWDGWHSIKGQTIQFTALNKFSEIPLIPISKAK
ncbi:MAG: hypothetical protein EZS28_041588, partial [Streblomastix strix]